MRSENNDLKQNLTFTQAELSDLKKFSAEQGNRIDSTIEQETSMGNMSERIRAMEDYSRRNNVIVDGVPETKEENNEQLQAKIVRINSDKLFKDKLGIEPDIEVIHRIWKSEADRPKSVILKLRSFKDRQDVLNAASRLRGTNVYLNEDVSRATMQIRREKFPELKERRKQGYIAYFSDTNTITKRRSIPNPQVELMTV